MKNWKTTTSGILTALVAVITAIIIPLLNSETLNADSIVTAVMSIITAIGLICAKDSGTGSGGGAGGGTPQDIPGKTIKAVAKTLGYLILICAIPLIITACGHNVTVTPDHTEICKDGSCLTLDKGSQSITYTQHTAEPPQTAPAVIVQQSK